MNEHAAWNVLLVQAIENADSDGRTLSDDDRRHASRSAHELALWAAAEQKLPMSTELFLEKRAELVLQKIGQRSPLLKPWLGPGNSIPRALGALPVAALLAGFLADRIGDPHRVDLLSLPLLLIAWNLAVYLTLVLWPVLPGPWKQRLGLDWTGRLARLGARLPGKPPGQLLPGLAGFATEWAHAARPLLQARLSAALHLGAAGFALGAVLSLYWRGLSTQYQIGWESSFLQAQQVHAILSTLYAPAMLIFRIPGFSTAELQALELTRSVAQTDAVRWVQLVAGTLFLLVLLPRLAMALAARWRVQRLARRFTLDLGQPYFRKLTAGIGQAAPAVLRVFPYSYTVDEARDQGLLLLARMLFGEQARLMLRPSTAYGQDPPALALPDGAGIALTLLLFNLSATPERETHGAFLEYFLRVSTPQLLVCIDESSYLERMGKLAGADTRLRERIALWQQFCELHHAPCCIVHLLQPHTRAAEFERGLAAAGRTP